MPRHAKQIATAHFNLREEYLPYKQLIGKVILDKNTTVKTVVNKLDSIDNEFRFFQMEVMGGEPEFRVITSENGCTFRFDFSKVYWNSRLQMEHTRLVDSFEAQDVIADGFAGVGPFAIPAAAKKGCLGVLANDLNPASAESLRDNVQLNKVSSLHCFLSGVISKNTINTTGRGRREVFQHGWTRLLQTGGQRRI